MVYLRNFVSKNEKAGKVLNAAELFSVFYHNIFDYPLTFLEIIKWTPRNALETLLEADYKNGFYFIKGRGGLIYKRMVRKRCSKNKIKIARKASKIISILPGVKMVSLTGSLAMENADKKSDIDLMIVTKNGALWITRILTYILLILTGFKLRKPMGNKQNDRLCLNIWLDEGNLGWGRNERNFYTAHEILQTIPLVSKEKTYERFLASNKWVLNFWPNTLEIKPDWNSLSYTKSSRENIIEKIAFKIQYFYMRPKITREIVKPTRAIFHPNNLSKTISQKLLLTQK